MFAVLNTYLYTKISMRMRVTRLPYVKKENDANNLTCDFNYLANVM